MKTWVIFIGLSLLAYCAKAQNQYSKSECDTNLFIENTITPNGDGINVDFIVHFKRKQPDSFEMKLYNRWGELIFETKDLHKGWVGNGKDGKTPVKEGVYYWITNYAYTIYDEKLSCTGYVTLLR